MTNRSDLDECSAQIKLVKQLIDQPETFDLGKVLIELETKKKLLIKFMPRDYTTILKGLESGALVLEEKEEKTEAEKLKAAAIKAEKIAAKKAELAALEAEEVES